MKKCYWCAEEIQDDAKICRYCGRDVVNFVSPTSTSTDSEKRLNYFPNPDLEAHEPVNSSAVVLNENVPQVATKELPRLKWHQNILLRAIFFGIAMGFILTNYVLSSTSPSTVWGYSGYISNALLQGWSSVIIYFGLYLLLGSIYRGINKKKKNTDLQKRQAILKSEFLFVIGVIFLVIIALVGLEKILLTVGQKAAAEPIATIAPSVTAIKIIYVTPTKATTPTNNIANTDTVIARQERELKVSLQAFSSIKSMKDRGWIFQDYLDDLKVEINKTSITLTLSESPGTEENFKIIARQLIRYTAVLTVGNRTSIAKRVNSLDFVVTSINVVSQNMAAYTIVGYVKGYENIVDLTEDNYNWDQIQFEKYYK